MSQGTPVRFGRHLGHVVDASNPDAVVVRDITGNEWRVHWTYLKPWERLPGPLEVIKSTLPNGEGSE